MVLITVSQLWQPNFLGPGNQNEPLHLTQTRHQTQELRLWPYACGSTLSDYSKYNKCVYLQKLSVTLVIF